jgi:apolipoprotein D and lipocalin family protein
MIRFFASITLCGVLLGLGACRTTDLAPLPTAGPIDLARYSGTWFEVAHLPNRFQADCAADTQAHYALEGEMIRVVNRCRESNGTIKQARGIAKRLEASENAKLRVSFFRPFYGDYWILAIDPDYQWVLVGEPTRRYAWVLSRQPRLSAELVDQILARAADLGFDRAAFRFTVHRDLIK